MAMQANPGVNARDTAPALQCLTLSASGAAVSPGRAICFDCTATGTITVTFNDGSQLTFHCTTGTVYEFNWAVVAYSVANSAGGTFYNLY